jgi:hypothetical protein
MSSNTVRVIVTNVFGTDAVHSRVGVFLSLPPFKDPSCLTTLLHQQVSRLQPRTIATISGTDIDSVAGQLAEWTSPLVSLQFFSAVRDLNLIRYEGRSAWMPRLLTARKPMQTVKYVVPL